MLTSITLRNFKSFGEEQTIPLQPITALVGPNASGKSNLVSVGRFVRNAVTVNAESAFKEEGGMDFVFHRPAIDAEMKIAWQIRLADDREGAYSSTLSRVRSSSTIQRDERLELTGHGSAWIESQPDKYQRSLPESGVSWDSRAPMGGLWHVVMYSVPPSEPYRPIWMPVVNSKEIKLSLLALRRDARVVADPELGVDGSGVPAVLGLWRGAYLDRARELDEFVHRCLPEIKHVLAKPGPNPGEQRLWIQQVDGEQFDAAHVSDGVLCFIALAMHAIEAEPGSLLFIEEPEQSIHPRRLSDLVDLLRQIVHLRQCQVVVATHSPVLLHELRDEPEAIVLFRRGEKGTLVNPLTDFPDLMTALDKRAEPGEMLVNGFLNEPS